MMKFTRKIYFAPAILAVILLGAFLFNLNNRAGNFQEEVAGRIINCSNSAVLRTFTLFPNGEFKMMNLPADIWGTYAAKNINEDTKTAEVQFTAKKIYTSHGEMSSLLTEKPMRWTMKTEWRKGAVDVKMENVIFTLGQTAEASSFEVKSQDLLEFSDCKAEQL